jgi:hypothetical protein
MEILWYTNNVEIVRAYQTLCIHITVLEIQLVRTLMQKALLSYDKQYRALAPLHTCLQLPRHRALMDVGGGNYWPRKSPPSIYYYPFILSCSLVISIPNLYLTTPDDDNIAIARTCLLASLLSLATSCTLL